MLEIRNLTVVYNGGTDHVTALDDISLHVKKGDSLGIMGESGCGKSTLAMAIMQINNNAKISGEILFNHKNLLKMSKKKLKSFKWRKIAIVFQNSLEVFNPVISTGEQIAEPLITHFGITKKEADLRVQSLFELVGLDPLYRHRYAHQLSGGMRQKVLIAMAVSCNPELLIIDEPTTSLDPESSNQIVELIKDLKKQMGFSLIMISHNLTALRQVTAKIVTMYCGQIVESGITADVIRNPMHCYTRGLLNASPVFFKYKDLWGIRGVLPQKNHEKCCSFHSRCSQSEDICSKKRPELKYVAVERKVACHKGGIETFLNACGICKTYRLKHQKNTAVSDLNLIVKSGEVVALIGKSGSGKSTLAHILVNLLQQDKGEIFFMGKKVNGFSATGRTGGMQLVFQDPFSSISSRLKVLDVVREPLDVIKWESLKKRNEMALHALSMVCVPSSGSFLQRYSHALSGGQRQRLAIARALVSKPKLLIADEITSMLDPSTSANLLRELKGLQSEQGFSMLYITHDFHLARKVADRVYVMDKGRIVESGVSFEVFETPAHSVTKSLINFSLAKQPFRLLSKEEYGRHNTFI